MGFIRRLFQGTPAQPQSNFYTFHVKCKRCGEVLEGRINMSNDLSLDEGEDSGYHVRKVVMGSGHCFQQIEVEMDFDANRKLVDRRVQGGEFFEEAAI